MTDQGDWYTMQMLKQDMERMQKEDPVRYRYEIDWNKDCLTQLKKKALVQ